MRHSRGSLDQPPSRLHLSASRPKSAKNSSATPKATCAWPALDDHQKSFPVLLIDGHRARAPRLSLRRHCPKLPLKTAIRTVLTSACYKQMMRRAVAMLTQCVALLATACGRTTADPARATGNTGNTGNAGDSGATLSDAGIVGPSLDDAGSSEPSAACNRVDIPDPELLRQIRIQLSLSMNDELTPARLLELSYLDAIQPSDPPIVSLEGL